MTTLHDQQRNEQPSLSWLAVAGLIVGLCWCLIMLVACIWYFSLFNDPQGWDRLVLVLPGFYLWIPFSVVGGLLGAVAWFRIRARPEALRGSKIALAAIALSLACPLIGRGVAYTAIALKSWLHS